MFGKANGLSKAQHFAESIRDDCDSIASQMATQLKAMGLSGDLVLSQEQLTQIATDKTSLLVAGIRSDAKKAPIGDVIGMLDRITAPSNETGKELWDRVVASTKEQFAG